MTINITITIIYIKYIKNNKGPPISSFLVPIRSHPFPSSARHRRGIGLAAVLQLLVQLSHLLLGQEVLLQTRLRKFPDGGDFLSTPQQDIFIIDIYK